MRLAKRTRTRTSTSKTSRAHKKAYNERFRLVLQRIQLQKQSCTTSSSQSRLRYRTSLFSNRTLSRKSSTCTSISCRSPSLRKLKRPRTRAKSSCNKVTAFPATKYARSRSHLARRLSSRSSSPSTRHRDNRTSCELTTQPRRRTRVTRIISGTSNFTKGPLRNHRRPCHHSG